MIPEIGHFALILALSVAVVQGVFPLIGSLSGKANWVAMAKPAAKGQFLFMLVSFAALVYAFVTNDFSVKYVAMNSNSQMPTIFRVSAVWGAHEGSLLLWAAILSGWGAAVAFFSKGIPPIMLARVLGVMGLVGVGFMLFMLLTSNPFERLLNIPLEGRQLNPLLQDFGLAIHPPMLYMGYVGMSVAFSFAVAAMIGGKLDAAWARWARPWTNIAWMFLTFGITLGSWWAYYELGWGGWWFWDPVENASLMPWIVGTALIHSLAVTEKRGAFKAWTILLAIFAFSLSLLGTFLVRSGVLTSVHSFASDPERGLFILAFLLVVIGSSLTLFAFRASKLRSSGTFSVVSRESGLLVNNVILLVMTAAVLIGTLYPLINDAVGSGKISVGPPYFNIVMVPLAILLYVVMGTGFFLRWKKDSAGRIVKKLWMSFVLSLVIAIIIPLLFASQSGWKVAIGMFAASWVALTALMWLLGNGRSPFKLPLASWGSVIAHLGMAMAVVGITLVSLYDSEKDVRLEKGQAYQLAGFDYKFMGVETHKGPNYTANRATIEVSRDGKALTVLHPEKRDYGPRAMPMTEAGIDGGFTRDLFVALGEPLGGNAWSFRIYHKPFVRWIWLGGVLMGLGGLMAALDKRYRRVRKIALDPLSTNQEKSKNMGSTQGATI
jgi:cytochrome c-type biogenesis protein CcmF